MMKPSGKFRNWQFTYYPKTLEEGQWVQRQISPPNAVYGNFGIENCPSTGRTHLQGMVCFENPRSFDGVREYMNNCRIEPIRSMKGLAKYNSKDGLFWEAGTMPGQEQGKRTDMDLVKEMILSKKYSWQEVIIHTNPSNVRWAQELYKTFPRSREATGKVPKIYWFHGPSGCGKSRKARAMMPEACIVTGNLQFWNGYVGQTEVILQEVRKGIAMNEFLCCLDRYDYMVNVKGTFTPLMANHIVITSCLSVKDFCTGTGENYIQFTRRIEESGGYIEAFGTGTEVQGNTNAWTSGENVDKISKTPMISIAQIPDLYN